MNRKFIVAVALLLLTTVFFCGCQPEVGESGNSTKKFDTPEQAIEHFFTGLKEGSINKALEACAIEEYATQFNFQAYTERMMAMIPTSPAPAEYSMYGEFNAIKRRDYWAKVMLNMSYALTSDNEIASQLNEGLTVTIENNQEITDFIQDVDPSKLADIKVVRVDVCFPKLQNEEQGIQYLNSYKETRGCEEACEYSVLFEHGGNTYAEAITLLKYDGGWKLDGNASLAYWEVNMVPKQMTEEEYETWFELE